MIHSSRFVALLDACVLYPAPTRDLLLNLADFELYIPKWTDQIHEEWTRNLLLNRPELNANQLQKTVKAMYNAFPDANVEHYEQLISSINLTDKDDRHVLAAAIRCQATIIVTSNLKDFPNDYLKLFDIEAQHPDHFIAYLIDLNPKKSIKAFHQQVTYLKNRQ
ncbi:PIN domain-containing protein [Spirosoma flavus]